jgi:hypothetical protein
VPSPGEGAGEVVRYAVDIPALVGARDEWCVSFLAIGPSVDGSPSLFSDWSAPRCANRRSDSSSIPEYLPWPMLEDAPEGRELRAGVQGIPGLVGYLRVDIEPVKPVDASTLLRNCIFNPQESVFFLEEGKLAADAMLEDALGFVAYRQRRAPGGVGGDWVQVSPLIEFAHWDPYDPAPEEQKFLARYLRDPYVFLRRNDFNDDRIRAWTFVDRYPYSLTDEYRYQFVYFDRDHAVVETRMSDWIGVGLDPRAGEALP